jgi:hypothetical protein
MVHRTQTTILPSSNHQWIVVMNEVPVPKLCPLQRTCTFWSRETPPCLPRTRELRRGILKVAIDCRRHQALVQPGQPVSPTNTMHRRLPDLRRHVEHGYAIWLIGFYKLGV